MSYAWALLQMFWCVRFSAIDHINKSFVWAHYKSQLTVSYRRTVHLLLEPLLVRCEYLSVSCLSQADITYDTDSISIVPHDVWDVLRHLLYLYFVFDFVINKNKQHFVIHSSMECVIQGITQFYLPPNTSHTCLYSPATEHHHRLTGTHCAWRNGQAELTSVAGYILRSIFPRPK